MRTLGLAWALVCLKSVLKLYKAIYCNKVQLWFSYITSSETWSEHSLNCFPLTSFCLSWLLKSSFQLVGGNLPSSFHSCLVRWNKHTFGLELLGAWGWAGKGLRTVTWTHLFVASELLVFKTTTNIYYFKMKALVKIVLFAFYLLCVLQQNFFGANVWFPTQRRGLCRRSRGRKHCCSVLVGFLLEGFLVIVSAGLK